MTIPLPTPSSQKVGSSEAFEHLPTKQTTISTPGNLIGRAILPSLFNVLFLLSFLILADPVWSTTVVDLSQNFESAPLGNQNQAYCNIQSSMLPFWIEGWAVIKDGKLAAEGYSNNNTFVSIFPAWSVTKSFSTMIVGKMVEMGQVTISETLGAIFNQTSDWEGVVNASDKQSITLEDLLTMTSGLKDGAKALEDQTTLEQVLNYVEYDAELRGTFNYISSSHILARIIHRRSGQTPRAFVQEQGIFKKLGISEFDYEWDQFGGVEGSAFGLHTTVRTLAKLGQLYLQNGLAAEGDPLIASDWINASTTDQIKGKGNACAQCLTRGYDYQWFAGRPTVVDPLPQYEGSYVAYGLNGQQILVIPAENAVIAIHSSDCTIFFLHFFVQIL